MSIERNENDKLPEDLVDNRAATYEGLMKMSYVWFLPAVLAVVMLITLLLLKVGVFVSLVLTVVTFVAVMIFSKTFFVH